MQRKSGSHAGCQLARSLLNESTQAKQLAIQMKAPSLALPILVLSFVTAHGQGARLKPLTAEVTSEHRILAQRAINSLRRLDDSVIVYQSLGEFEATNKLARVPFVTFNKELRTVSAEVEEILTALPDSRLKNEIRNSLNSYRDGAFWWAKANQPRVINVAEFSGSGTRSSTETFLLANAPYTVAIHWRQAKKYLDRAVRQAASLSQ